MPGDLAGSAPSFGIAAVKGMPMVFALPNGMLLDQRTQGPALEGAIGWPISLQRQFSLRGAFHWRASNQFDPPSIPFLSNKPFPRGLERSSLARPCCFECAQ
jgi:hypothetical protein